MRGEIALKLRTKESPKLTEVARTLTRTSWFPGTGSAISERWRTSGAVLGEDRYLHALLPPSSGSP